MRLKTKMYFIFSILIFAILNCNTLADYYPITKNSFSDGGTTLPPSGTQTMTLSNNSTYDGCISDTSTPYPSTIIIGDKNNGFEIGIFRGVLHFNTASLAEKTIQRAYLKINLSVKNNSPWSVGSLRIDIKTNYFNNNIALEGADYTASASVSNIATVPEWVSGEQNSGDFSPAGLNAINKVGDTQIRLYFNNTLSDNYIIIQGGAFAKLVVEYID